jgi:chromosome partitioning protein
MSSLLISLASLKGGVGKTTSAVHIAGQLVRRNIGGVAVVDRDRTRSATSWSRGGKLPFFVGTQDAVMRRAVDFSALVIDSRGGLENDELLEMAEASDFLLLPTNVEYMSLDAMAQTAEALGEMGAKSFAVLFTMAKPGKRLDTARRVLEELGLPVLASTVRQSDAFKDASEQSVLVRDVRGSKLAKNCWLDYEAVTEEIFARMEAQA